MGDYPDPRCGRRLLPIETAILESKLREFLDNLNRDIGKPHLEALHTDAIEEVLKEAGLDR